MNLNCYPSDVTSYSDYCPFGMLQPNRYGKQLGTEDYRYNFQGQETDDEVKGKGNSVNYKYRMHDPRLGRFFAVDPLASKYPHNAPYAFSENVVIHAVELEGLEKSIIINNSFEEYDVKIIVLTGDDVKKGNDFYAFGKLMSDIGLIDENTDLHFKATGLSSHFDGTDVILSANYEATWLKENQIVRMDYSIPYESVHINGTRPIDYPLALLGSGVYGQFLKKSLRPLYNQAATSIKNTDFGFIN